jgi:hypothetical protein
MKPATKKTKTESDTTPVMSTSKKTQLELLLKIEQYKYKMMRFENYRKILADRVLCAKNTLNKPFQS